MLHIYACSVRFVKNISTKKLSYFGLYYLPTYYYEIRSLALFSLAIFFFNIYIYFGILIEYHHYYFCLSQNFFIVFKK
jgi:hypothetical protein